MASNGMTGAEAAQRILSAYGVHDVTIQHISGNLTDNYNPKDKTLNLSDSVIASNSIAAIGVAAHECGHVMQHETDYMPLRIRTALVPVANIGSNIGIWIVMIGVILGMNSTLAMIGVYLFSFGVGYLDSDAADNSIGSTIFFIGIVLFALAVLFYLVTLPVELDASRRALKILEKDGLLAGSEMAGARSVLSAAAMTYVAAAASAIVTLLRLISYGKRRS